jgi:hypothetical protein
MPRNGQRHKRLPTDSVPQLNSALGCVQRSTPSAKCGPLALPGHLPPSHARPRIYLGLRADLVPFHRVALTERVTSQPWARSGLPADTRVSRGTKEPRPLEPTLTDLDLPVAFVRRKLFEARTAVPMGSHTCRRVLVLVTVAWGGRPPFLPETEGRTWEGWLSVLSRLWMA